MRLDREKRCCPDCVTKAPVQLKTHHLAALLNLSPQIEHCKYQGQSLQISQHLTNFHDRYLKVV